MKKLNLERIVFHENEKSLSYSFMLEGDRRIVTFEFSKAERVVITVRKKIRERPLLQVLIEKGSILARTPDGEFQLRKEQRVLPDNTDRASLWIVAQNLLDNPTLRPDVIMDWINQDLVSKNEEQSSTTETHTATSWVPIVGVPGAIWAGISIFEYFSGGDCLNPDQKADCQETDPSGSVSTVQFQCECGTPICQTTAFTVDVPVVVVNKTTGDQESSIETLSYTKCICYCIELSNLQA